MNGTDAVPSGGATKETHAEAGPGIFAIIVLYRLSPEQSPAFETFTSLVQQSAEALRRIGCLVHDNSPEPHKLPSVKFPCRYTHDPGNPGLARPYQQALQQAQDEGKSWLLLLDQDTELTPRYLKDVLEATRERDTERSIMALVPRLTQDGQLLSPHLSMGGRVDQFHDRPGICQPGLKFYNSGAVLRVAAVSAAGGFPEEFPLDYLDHAVFHKLQANGQVLLLGSTLQHQLGSRYANPVKDLLGSARLQAMIAAESRYYRRYGTQAEATRLLLRRGKMILKALYAGELRNALLLFRITYLPEGQ